MALRFSKIRHLLPYAAFIILISFSFSLWYSIDKIINQDLYSQFKTQADFAYNTVKERTALYLVFLGSVKGLFAASETVTRSEFSTYFRNVHLSEEYPGISDLFFAERIKAENKNSFAEKVRADKSLGPEGYSDFKIYPAGERQEYFVINYAEPYGENAKLQGYDLYSYSPFRQTMDAARSGGRPVITPPINLPDMFTHAEVILAFVPIYRNDMPSSSPEERRDALAGFVVAAFDVNTIFKNLLQEETSADFDIAIFDGESFQRENMLYDYAEVHGRINLAVDPSYRSKFEIVKNIEVDDRIWTLRFLTLPGFSLDFLHTIFPELSLLFFIVFSVVAALAVNTLVTSYDRALLLAENMTKSLRESERKLKTILDNNAVGIGISRYPDYHFTMANPRLSQIWGYSEEELKNLTFKDITHPEELARDARQIQRLANGEMPVYRVDKRYIRKDKKVIWCSTNVALARDDEGKPLYFIVTVEDITIQKEAQENLENLARFPGENPNPVLRISTDDILIYKNPATEMFCEEPHLDCKPGDRVPLFWQKLIAAPVKSGKTERDLEVKVNRRTFSLTIVPLVGKEYVNVYATDITERKIAENALRQSEENFKRAQEIGSIGNWRLDVQKNELIWSDEAYRIFGVKKGTPMTYETFLAIVHPDDRKFVDEKWKSGMAGEKYDIEHRIIANGKTKWVREKAFLEFDKLGKLLAGFGITQDITERKRAEQEIAKLAEIVKEAPTALALVDLGIKNLLRYVNPAWENLFGYTYDEVVDKKEGLIVEAAKRDPKLYDKLMNSVKNRKRFHADMFWKRKDGELIPVEVYTVPVFDEPGNVVIWLNTIVDISERKKIEQAKDSFLSLAAHQLRTPLGGTRWNLEMILGGDYGKVPKVIKNPLKQVYTNNLQLIDLVSDILDVSRINLGQIKDEPEHIFIKNIIKDGIKNIEHEIKKRKLKVEVKIGAIPKMFIDPRHLRQVMGNLLSNAVKYNKNNGKVSVKAAREGDNVLISVSDTGIGIPKSDFGRMFEKFFRSENAVKTETEGTGLGLFVAKYYVESWGGKIWFDSKEGKGSTFYVRLPIKPKSAKLSKNK